MVVIRPTRKLHAQLRLTTHADVISDGALGDWYASKFVVDRQPLLIIMSSESLVSFLMPARDVRSLPKRLPSIVSSGLRRLGLEESLIEAEIATMTPVAIAATNDHSVLGSLVNFSKLVQLSEPNHRSNESSLRDEEAFLQKTPCRCGGVRETIFPIDKTRELLRARWIG